MIMSAIIQFSKVVKTFPGQTILDEVDMDIPAGKTTVIAGASGQGKSVSIKLILGLMKPDSGQILVNGRDITRLRKRELRKVRSDFGVLFQGVALFDSLTIYENVAMPLEERTKLSAGQIRKQVMEKLDLFGLLGHENKFPAQISGGMRKRVGLARALMLQPRIMLFDEPTTGLDPAMSMEIYRLFYETQKQFGYTAVIVSHDIPKIFNLADQVAILHKRKMHMFNSPDEIILSEEPEIKSFVRMTMGHVYQSHLVETGE
jgi:phospholipid/cholesterol/gamma-HCH transport system ATP-binding protein